MEKEEKKTMADDSISFLLKKKKWFVSLPKFQKILVVLAGVVMLFVLYIISVLVRYNDSSIASKTNTEDQGKALRGDLGTNRFESFPLEEPGLVCFGDNRFSIRIDAAYRVLSDGKNGIALFTNDSLLTVSTNGKPLVERLKDFDIPYTQDANVYFYKVPLNKNATNGASTSYGVSQEKNGSVVSVFSFKKDDKDALRLLPDVTISLTEGCLEEND